MDDILAFMDATKDLQFDAYHVMPYHPLMGLDGMEKFYQGHRRPRAEAALDVHQRQLVPRFPAGILRELKAHKNIAGVKFSSSRTTDQIKVIGLAETDFQVITAVATQFIMVLGVGVAASTTSQCRRAAGAAASRSTIFISRAAARKRSPHSAVQRLPGPHAEARQELEFPHRRRREIHPVAARHLPALYDLVLHELNEEEQAQMRKALDEFGYLKKAQKAA